MPKTDVYSWRVDPAMKARLERRARAEGVSLANLLDRMAHDWLASLESAGPGDEAVQASLREAAHESIGALSGGDPSRSTKTRDAVRKRLARRRHAS